MYAICDPWAEVITKYGNFLLLETTVMTYPITVISGKQIRAARALLGWKQRELAAAASVSEVSIKNAERAVVDSRGSTLNAWSRGTSRLNIALPSTVAS